MFDSTAEVCDAFIDAEDSWILMEFKGVLFTTRARYVRDTTILKKEIESKFIGRDNTKKNDVKNERKGVKQLAHSIKRLIDGDKPTGGDLDISNCKRIYPVLVVYDTSVSGKFLSDFLDDILKRELGILPNLLPKVMPLSVLSVVDLEAFTAIGRKRELTQLLASYRERSSPFISFKDHSFKENERHINVNETYSSQNFNLLHTDISKDFSREVLPLPESH
jgi:hypothetical protein